MAFGLLELAEARAWYLLELAGVWATMTRFFLSFLSLSVSYDSGRGHCWAGGGIHKCMRK